MLETARLQLRELDAGDADFIVALLNDPAFIEFIGDRGVRTPHDALGYVARIRESYLRHGFGLYVVLQRSDGRPTGLCGLVRRDSLPSVDLGFAFLPEFRRHGYGLESATAVLAQARALGIDPLLAICSPHNLGSRALLERLGFHFIKQLVLDGESAESCWYER